MPAVFFGIGDYQYSNYLYPGPIVSETEVAVAVKKPIRETVVDGLADIPSTVTYNGVTYTVKYLIGYHAKDLDAGFDGGTELVACFENCRKLTQVPNLPQTINYRDANSLYEDCEALQTFNPLPEGITQLNYTYRRCYSALQFPAIPSTVTSLSNTYEDARSMTQAPTLPPGLTSMSLAFQGCQQLATPPTIPTTVTNMNSAFNGCTMLASAPEIPASVTEMPRAFQRCAALAGSIVVNNDPSARGSLSYQQMFTGTQNDIYIINGGNAGSVWQNSIAPAYSNVHYEADDHPNPNLMSLQLTRVASSGSTTPAEQGLWAYLSAQVEISTAYLPTGWTGRLSTISLKLDGATISPTWTTSGGPTGTLTLTAWVNVGDTNAHTFEMFAEENVSSGLTVKKVLSTPIITQTLPKAFALIDYYHDDATNLEGVAIGKYAERANLFDVAMPTRHNNKVTFRDDITLEGEGLLDLGEVAYGLSSTAAGTTTKVVTTSLGTFSLTSGQYVIVKFDNATSTSTSMNVDSTGSKQAYYNGSRISSSNGAWSAGDLVIFEYDGTYYQRIMPDDSSLPVEVKLAYNILALGWTDCFEQEVHIL